jgi:hypothetical protein
VRSHDDQAQRIASNAIQLMTLHMRPADMWCYLMRLLTTLGMGMGFDAVKEMAAGGTFHDLKWEPMTGEYVSREAGGKV